MKYRTLIPINHSGQPIPVGAVFSASDAFGRSAKTPLDIDQLLGKGRIEVVPSFAAEGTPGPDPVAEPKPADPEPKPADKGKKF